jgi:hypothetical protein
MTHALPCTVRSGSDTERSQTARFATAKFPDMHGARETGVTACTQMRGHNPLLALD